MLTWALACVLAAHPRSRGENWSVDGEGEPRVGSSPLTRGKPLFVAVSNSRSGLIPAHAGKTVEGVACTTRRGAHPRSRGENLQPATHNGGCEGSSPLTRGKQRRHMQTLPVIGLIPAHAGKTPFGQAERRRSRAHPRSRGENLALAPKAPLSPGSSPLTRGKLAKNALNDLSRRLIPAHAGKTSRNTHVLYTRWAHPRSRGENKI